LADLVSKVKLLENLEISSWKKFTNKQIYSKFADSFTKPKVERDSCRDMSGIWKRLKIFNCSTDVHEITYLMIHNKLPLRERLFRVKLSPDPYCQACPSAEIEDISHYFTTCQRVKMYWSWTRKLCLKMLGVNHIDDEVLLKLDWPNSSKDRDISWLVSHYIFIVWDMLFTRKLVLIGEKEFFGFLKFRYKEALGLTAVSRIPGIL